MTSALTKISRESRTRLRYEIEEAEQDVKKRYERAWADRETIVMKVVKASGYEKWESVLDTCFLYRVSWSEQSASNILNYRDQSPWCHLNIILFNFNTSSAHRTSENFSNYMIFFSFYRINIIFTPTPPLAILPKILLHYFTTIFEIISFVTVSVHFLLSHFITFPKKFTFRRFNFLRAHIFRVPPK